MRLVRILAALAFIVGIGLLVVAFVRSDDGGATAAPATAPASVIATATPTPTLAPTDAPTEVPTPTATPYDGAVARLKIPAFDVDSAIEPIGLLPTNTLDTPHDPYDTGWYDIYDKPGFGGNAVFSAHVDYFPNIRGPFYNLHKLELGDIIVVTMDDGTEYRYQVIKAHLRYDVRTIPMGDLIWPQDRPEGKEWVTLITCGGRFEQTQPSGAGEYLDRDVVVAERIT